MLDRDQVLHVARLARLELTEDEVDRMAAELSHVLDHIEAIRELDLEGVPPTAHPLELENAWAEDEPRRCLPLDDVFANAPDREGDYFRVPPA